MLTWAWVRAADAPDDGEIARPTGFRRRFRTAGDALVDPLGEIALATSASSWPTAAMLREIAGLVAAEAEGIETGAVRLERLVTERLQAPPVLR
jgi:hypothetical protein